MPQHGRIILLSGESGSGKTTLCLRMIDKLRLTSLSINGIVSPPEFTGTIKTGISIIDLHSGEKRSLALLAVPGSEGLQTRKWLFNEDAIRWGNVVIAKAVPCDVLVIDELGPLEFERGLGFINGFTAVDSGKYQYAVVVIRPSLLEKAANRWPTSQVIMVAPETRDTLADELVKSFLNT